MDVERWLFRGFAAGLVAIVVIAGAALWLSGGSSAQPDQPLSIACDDPGVALDHNTSYRPDILLDNQSRIATGQISRGEGIQVELQTLGPIVDSNVSGANGEAIVVVDNRTATISQPSPSPMRVVVDSVDNSTVYRTEIGICPKS